MIRLRLTPIGLSVLVNLALIAVMSRVLMSSPTPEQRYIAVELRAVVPSVVHRSPLTINHQPSTIPHPPLSISHQPSTIPHPPSPINHQPSTIPHSPVAIGHPTQVAGVQQSFTAGGGGTTATGPGAAVGAGPGPGNGTSDPGPNTAFVPQPSPTPNPQLPTPPSQPITYNPQPKTNPAPPKGESRGPSVASQTKPIYPSDAREDGVEGTAVVTAFVDPEGKVVGTKLEKSSGDRRLDRAALDAVGKWTYNPSVRDGTPVKSSVRVTVQFKLE